MAADADWIEAFRRAVAAQQWIFSEHRGIEARTVYEGVGEGGDRTLVIDRLCEDAIFAELDALHAEGHEFTAISEERGQVVFGNGDSPVRVVIDPIDGSLNARRTIPWHSFTVAVADGNSMADVKLGYVYEFGASEEFVASAGGGATLDGIRISVPSGDGLEVISVESNKPARLLAAAQALDGKAYRVRTPGLDRGLARLPGGRPLRRNGQRQVPLGRCGGRPADRARGGRLGQLRGHAARGGARSISPPATTSPQLAPRRTWPRWTRFGGRCNETLRR